MSSLQFRWLSAGYGQCQGTSKQHSGRVSWTDWRGHSVRFSWGASSQVVAILGWCGIGGSTATFWSLVCYHSSLLMSHSPTLSGRTLMSKRLVLFRILFDSSSFIVLPILYYDGSAAQGGGGSFRIGNLYRRAWLLWIANGRANPLMDRKVVGVMFCEVAAMVAMVTWSVASPATAGCSVV